tara:strand:+ start:169 stop:324 length:156 start_codon:yes stop_codon:yes gene_type:complete
LLELVTKVILVQVAQAVLLAHQVHLELLDHKAFKVQLVQQAAQALKVFKAL